MNEFQIRTSKIESFWQCQAKYLLAWCFIYNSVEDLESPLLSEVRRCEFDFPACLLFLRIDENPWVREELAVTQNLPRLEVFCSCMPLARITSVANLNDEMPRIIDFALQLKPAWSKNSREGRKP